MVTDTARPPQTHPQTGPITIHCAAKPSAQCNNTRVRIKRIYVITSDEYGASIMRAFKMITVHVYFMRMDQLNGLTPLRADPAMSAMACRDSIYTRQVH